MVIVTILLLVIEIVSGGGGGGGGDSCGDTVRNGDGDVDGDAEPSDNSKKVILIGT